MQMRLEFWLIIGLLAACDSGEKPTVASRDRPSISRESAEGFRLLQQGRPGEALALLQQAAEKDSASMEVHYNMGVAHTHLKEYAKAIVAFERAVTLVPENPGAHFALGIALGVEHRQCDAAKHFARAAALAPDRAEYHFRLGEARQALGEVEGAARGVCRGNSRGFDARRCSFLARWAASFKQPTGGSRARI